MTTDPILNSRNTSRFGSDLRRIFAFAACLAFGAHGASHWLAPLAGRMAAGLPGVFGQ